jgi:transcriptional regulator with XRE-family HTH domain
MIDYDLKAFIAARGKHRLSQADLAKLAKVTEKTIVNFENGQKARSAWGHRVILAYRNIGRGPAAASTLDDDLADDFMKAQQNRRFGPRQNLNAESRSFNGDWLQSQTRAFISDNDLTILERGRTGERHIMISKEQLLEFGRLLILAVTGKNVE